MDRLIEELRGLDPPAPPPAVHVDDVITGEQRRARRVRLIGGAGAIVVAAALVAAAPWMYRPGVPDDAARPPSLCGSQAWPGPYWSPDLGAYTWAVPTGTPPPKAPDGAVARLDVALAAGLEATLPDGVTVVDGEACGDAPAFRPAALPSALAGTPGGSTVVPNTGPSGEPLNHYAMVRTPLELADDNGPVLVTVSVGTAVPVDGTVGCRQPQECALVRRSDGSVVFTGQRDMNDLRQMVVEVYRADGTAVRVSQSNARVDCRTGRSGCQFLPSRPDLLLSADQLLAIADTPGLTPVP